MEPKPERLARLLLAGLLGFVFFAACFHISDIDLGYHIRTGAYVMKHHEIPAVNTFAYTTPDEPWYLHQWLPATGLYLLDKLGGVYALTTAKCLLAALAMLLTWLTARRLGAGDSLWPFWAITLATIIGRTRFFERPDFLSGVIFTLVLYLDTRCGRSRRWQWLVLPLLFAAWANIHGGLVYGLALLFALSAGEWATVATQKFLRWKPADEDAASLSLKELLVRPAGMALAVLAAIVSTQLINPHGAKILLVPFQFNNQFWKGVITELQTPIWHENRFFYLSLPVLALLLILSRKHWSFARCFILCGFTLLALDAQRSLLFFAFAMAPFAAQMAAQVWPLAIASSKRWVLALLPVTWIAIVLLKFVPDPQYQFGYGRYPGFYPTGVFAFMEREVPAQNIFNEMRYGGPLLWQNYPQFKPFVDGRGDAYSVAFWESEYLPVINQAPGWRDILDRWQVSAMLLPIPLDHQLTPLGQTMIKDTDWALVAFWESEYLPVINQATGWRDILDRWQVSAMLLPIPLDHQLTPLGQTMIKDTDWALVAFDDNTMLFLRRNPLNQAVIAEYEFKLIGPDDWSLGKVTSTNAPAAAKEAARVLELAPDSVFGLTAAARATLVHGDYDTAAQFYAQLVVLPGANALYFRDYGFALMQLNRLKEADEVFVGLQKRGELAGYPAFMRHFIALKENRPAEARQFLDQAIKLEPANPEYQAALRALGGK